MPTTAKKPKYAMKITLNGVTHACDTDDIAEAILSLDVKAIKTKVVIAVATKQGESSRILWGHQARRVLKNKMAAKVFADQMVRVLINK